MTRCDHGIRLDAFCEACEDGWFRDALGIPDTYGQPDYHRANRHRAGVIAALCFLALGVLVLGGTRHG